MSNDEGHDPLVIGHSTLVIASTFGNSELVIVSLAAGAGGFAEFGGALGEGGVDGGGLGEGVEGADVGDVVGLVEGDAALLVDDDGAAFGAVEGFLAGEHAVGLEGFAGGVGEEVVGDVVLAA